MEVLIATDGSKYGKWATEWVARMPFPDKPQFTLLHVMDVEALRAKGLIRGASFENLRMSGVEASSASARHRWRCFGPSRRRRHRRPGKRRDSPPLVRHRDGRGGCQAAVVSTLRVAESPAGLHARSEPHAAAHGSAGGLRRIRTPPQLPTLRSHSSAALWISRRWFNSAAGCGPAR